MSLAFRRLLRKRVVVNTDYAQAFDGILYKQCGPLLVLRNATLHESGTEPTELDGEVIVERDHVEFIQVTG